jgi:hypothetical protein
MARRIAMGYFVEAVGKEFLMFSLFFTDTK